MRISIICNFVYPYYACNLYHITIDSPSRVTWQTPGSSRPSSRQSSLLGSPHDRALSSSYQSPHYSAPTPPAHAHSTSSREDWQNASSRSPYQDRVSKIDLLMNSYYFIFLFFFFFFFLL